MINNTLHASVKESDTSLIKRQSYL